IDDCALAGAAGAQGRVTGGTDDPDVDRGQAAVGVVPAQGQQTRPVLGNAAAAADRAGNVRVPAAVHGQEVAAVIQGTLDDQGVAGVEVGERRGGPERDRGGDRVTPGARRLGGGDAGRDDEAVAGEGVAAAGEGDRVERGAGDVVVSGGELGGTG